MLAAWYLLLDIKDITEHWPQTQSLWGHDKLRQHKSTSYFYLSADENTAIVPFTEDQIFQSLLANMSDRCFFTNCSFILALDSPSYGEDDTTEMPNHRLVPAFWQKPSRTNPCFVRPSPKVTQLKPTLYKMSFLVPSHQDLPQILTVFHLSPCNE